MRITKVIFTVSVIVCLAGSALCVTPAASLQELIEKHMASIGTPEARTAAKNRVAQGTARYEVTTGGAGHIDGQCTVLSEAKNAREVWRFNTTNYRGEDLQTDGNKVQVSKGTYVSNVPNEPRRSVLGDFLYNEAALLREGIFFGTIGVNWPLLDAKYNSAKLSYEGVKTINGQQLHEVKYTPKKKSDAEVKLYFDEQFHHVLTIATMTVDPRLLSGATGDSQDFMNRGSSSGEGFANSQQQSVRYRMEQRFDDFQKSGDLMLPTHENVKFSAEGYATTLVNYDVKMTTVNSNVGLDPKNFQIK